MTQYSDELGKPTAFTWGPTGRLLTDTAPRGGQQVLSRIEGGTQTVVNHQTAGGQSTGYKTEQVGKQQMRSTITGPDGTQNVTTDTAEAGVATQAAPNAPRTRDR